MACSDHKNRNRKVLLQAYVPLMKASALLLADGYRYLTYYGCLQMSIRQWERSVREPGTGDH